MEFTFDTPIAEQEYQQWLEDVQSQQNMDAMLEDMHQESQHWDGIELLPNETVIVEAEDGTVL